jgi:tetratricopeptide (TPR) repeat protein
MNGEITATPAAEEKSDVSQEKSGSHFDAVDAAFFEQGRDEAIQFVDGEYFNEERSWFGLSRQFFMGLAIGSALGALVVGLLSGRGSGSTRVAVAEPVTPRQPSASTASTYLANSARAPRIGEQAGATGEAPVPGATHQEIVPSVDADAWDAADAARVPSAIEQAVKAAAPAAEPTLAVTAAPSEPAGENVLQACSKAIADKQKKRILTSCEEAFAANPRAADIAVVLAKIEFDRGRTAQAFEWSKKAIAANPDIADAYVFVGEAEQNAGHKQAAKDAYLHYLRLAPSGRYATDLRAVLRSL